MNAFTEMEIKVLNILAKTHGDTWQDEDGYAHPDTFLLTTDGTGECGTIFSQHNLDPKVYRGVIGSLEKKGALVSQCYETYTDRGREVDMVSISIDENTFNEIKAAA